MGLASSCENSPFHRINVVLPTFERFDQGWRPLDHVLLLRHNTWDKFNQIGAWFHSVGGHAHADKVLHQWLGAASEETFGGDYGESIGATPLMNERVLVNTELKQSSSRDWHISPSTYACHRESYERLDNGRVDASDSSCQRR